MKISKIILISALVLAGFTACKKDSDSSNKQTSIEGLWKGSYINDASGNSFFYSFNIKTGGVIEEVNSSGQKIGVGTWELENNILSAHYKWPGGSEYSVLGAFNKEQGKLLGNWGYGNSATNGGTWEMTKSN